MPFSVIFRIVGNHRYVILQRIFFAMAILCI
jgi:hypothetical protein